MDATQAPIDATQVPMDATPAKIYVIDVARLFRHKCEDCCQVCSRSDVKVSGDAVPFPHLSRCEPCLCCVCDKVRDTICSCDIMKYQEYHAKTRAFENALKNKYLKFCEAICEADKAKDDAVKEFWYVKAEAIKNEYKAINANYDKFEAKEEADDDAKIEASKVFWDAKAKAAETDAAKARAEDSKAFWDAQPSWKAKFAATKAAERAERAAKIENYAAKPVA